MCRGACVLDRPDRFRILPYKYYAPAVGRKAVVSVEFSELCGKLPGGKPGKRLLLYSQGPIFVAGNPWEHAADEVLLFTRVLSDRMAGQGAFYNYPAALWGHHRRDKVIATSFLSGIPCEELSYRNGNDLCCDGSQNLSGIFP